MPQAQVMTAAERLARSRRLDELAAAARRDPARRGQLIEATEGMLRGWVARRRMRLGLRDWSDRLDLCQSLRVATLESLGDWDEHRPFATYLAYWVWRAAAKDWRWRGRLIAIPPDALVRQARAATPAGRAARWAARPVASLSNPALADLPDPALDRGPAGGAPAAAVDRLGAALDALAESDPPAAQVIRWRYLHGREPLSYAEIARTLGCAKSWPWTLERRGLGWLRTWLARAGVQPDDTGENPDHRDTPVAFPEPAA